MLDRHGLTMRGYVVPLGLDDEPVYTQAALAKKIRTDKTPHHRHPRRTSAARPNPARSAIRPTAAPA
ncbi:hypothetical protein ACW2Q0_03465 [Nocardia sp. R16R-3T]